MQDPSTPSAARLPQVRSGASWAVATGHPEAARAAGRVLEQGGSVADAAIAASAVLTVTLPHATSLGGDAFILLRDARSGQVTGLNASGVAPQGIGAFDFRHGLPAHGALACVVPGLVRGWEAIHARHGVHPWQALFEEAVALAEGGCPVGASLAATVRERQDLLRTDPGCAALFLPGGRMLAEGALLRQPALARSLRAIAGEGDAALFRGPLGQALADGVAAAGGALRADDLARFQPEWVRPLQVAHGGCEVHAMPPNSLGVLMLMQLQALDALPPVDRAGEAWRAALWQVRAMRSVFAAAARHLGDPGHMTATASDLLGEGTRAEVLRRVLADAQPATPVAGAGTACVTVADAAGNAACIVQSVFNPFGSHFLEPATGILLNNRLSGFSHQPGTPNSIGPGRRCAHTLNPVIVTAGGRLRLVYASPGGASQTVTAVQVLANRLDRAMPLGEAVAAPRWAMDRQGQVLFEPQWPAADIAALRVAGLEFRQQANEYFFGSATAVEIRPDGSLLAAADARRQAAALAG